MKEIKTCTRCVMDDSVDTTITFDDKGVCNYCSHAFDIKDKVYFPNAEGEKKLNQLIDRLKQEGKGKKYDCLMGLSGGLDSSYLAYFGAVKWGLRILAIHIDDGFDTEIASTNIRRLCDAAKIKLVVVKPDAAQFNDLTRAFILSGVPNIAIPQDNILFACLHNEAKKYNVRNFLSGGNFALECILEDGNTHDAFDMANIKDIRNKFGTQPIDKLPMMSLFQKGIIDRYIYKVKSFRPLNYIDYNRDRAIEELHAFCEFNYYGGKHLENTLTIFTQLYWFYKKFGVDKRKSHFSSMIVSGQMTREEAILKLKEPLYDETAMQEVIDEVLNKLNINSNEFEKVMEQPPLQHTAYRTSFLGKIAKIYFGIRDSRLIKQ